MAGVVPSPPSSESFSRPIMSPLEVLLVLVSFFVVSELGSPEVPLLRAVLQIYSRDTLADESGYSLPPHRLLSSPSWIWPLYITTISPRWPLLSQRTLHLLLSPGKSHHTQGTNLAYSYMFESEEAQAEEEPLLFSGESCLCKEKEKDTSISFETPCDCNEKYAHRLCAQQWSNEKHNRTCGIYCHPYLAGFIAMSSLTTSPKNIVWPLCSTILAKLVRRMSSWVAHHRYLNLCKLASFVWKSTLSKAEISRFGSSDTYMGLQSYIFFSFKERASSQWERSILPPSSVTERTFPSLPYSSVEETFGFQPQILPLVVDTSLTGFKTHFLSNSTKLESIFRSDSITRVMLDLMDTHVDLYEILQVSQDSKKCFISMLNFGLYLCTNWFSCFKLRVFGLIPILCTLIV